MIYVKSQYFYLNRILLLAIGLWPYKKSKLIQLQLIFSYSVLLTFVIFQLTTFLTSRCTTDLIINVFSALSICIVCIISYNALHINNKVIKILLDQIQLIYDELNDEKEIAIMEKYGNDAKRYTAGLIIFAVCGISVGIVYQFRSDILDIVSPINQSRPHRLYFIQTEYFVDQDKYFYWIILHINTAICIAAIIMLAMGTTLIAYLQHVCGMLKIACYRLTHAMETKETQNIDMWNEDLICKNISQAVNIHRKAIKFAEFLISSFALPFFILAIIGVMVLSLNLFQVSQVISIKNKGKILPPLIAVIVCLLSLFLANYIGQEIIDHNNSVFIVAYNIQWYLTPVHIQRLILFILQRGNKSYGLSVGGLLVASLEYFATLLNMSLSYFTVIYSTR